MTQQATEALTRANVIRVERAHIKAGLKDRSISLTDALEKDCVQGMMLAKLLLAQRSWGPERVRKFLKAMGVSPDCRVRDLHPERRRMLVEAAPEAKMHAPPVGMWRCSKCRTRLKAPTGICGVCAEDDVFVTDRLDTADMLCPQHKRAGTASTAPLTTRKG